MKKGAKGAAYAGGYALAAGGGYYSYGKNYGAGAGVLMGLGEAAIFDLALSGGAPSFVPVPSLIALSTR